MGYYMVPLWEHFLNYINDWLMLCVVIVCRCHMQTINIFLPMEINCHYDFNSSLHLTKSQTQTQYKVFTWTNLLVKRSIPKLTIRVFLKTNPSRFLVCIWIIAWTGSNVYMYIYIYIIFNYFHVSHIKSKVSAFSIRHYSVIMWA